MTGDRRPESVLVVVYAGGTAEGPGGPARVLLMERLDLPGFWQSVTGSLEPGETPAEAAKRELAEETGIEGVPVDLRQTRRFEIFPELRHRFPPGVTHNLEHAFAFDAGRPVDVTLNRAEHGRCAWLPWPEAAERTGSWTNREAIESLFADGR